MFKRHTLSVIATAALLAACGGGDDSPSLRGTLLETPQAITTLSAAQINATTAAQGLSALSGTARCDVRVVALNYGTIGVGSENTNASGVMLVPAGACASASAPLVAFARGTEVQKSRTLANPADPETFLMAAMFAAQGYAVVATDYLGYAKSSYSFHPYLHADSEASSVIDSIRAARRAAAQQGLALSGKVMLAGYSQGGHASMAAHRAIEAQNANEISVVAGAHLAGPYNMSGALRLPTAIAGYQFFAPFAITAYQKVYGNIYANPSEAFKAPYAATIENLLPHPTLNTTTLVTSGLLPGAQGETPAQARDALMQPSFLTASQTVATHPLQVAAKANDLTDWSPRARTLLCGGSGDPTIPAALHQNILKTLFDLRGLTHVTSVDVDPQIRQVYGTNGQAPTDPTSAAYATYFSRYHGTYEPPFCYAQARALFDQVR